MTDRQSGGGGGGERRASTQVKIDGSKRARIGPVMGSEPIIIGP